MFGTSPSARFACRPSPFSLFSRACREELMCAPDNPRFLCASAVPLGERDRVRQGDHAGFIDPPPLPEESCPCGGMQSTPFSERAVSHWPSTPVLASVHHSKERVPKGSSFFGEKRRNDPSDCTRWFSIHRQSSSRWRVRRHLQQGMILSPKPRCVTPRRNSHVSTTVKVRELAWTDFSQPTM